MRSKSMFLMIACVCGAIAAVGASQFMQAQGTGGSVVEMTEIFVATRVINESEEIKAEMMALESWPAGKIPKGSTNDLTKVQGRFASQKLYAGEPIISEKLMDEASNITVAIPQGFSVVSMKADAASSVANLVRPGDRVNVLAYFTKSDLIPETGVRTVLTGVKVFAVDGRTARETETTTNAAANTVSLLIDKKDEEAWTYASELGKIRLSLGRPAESGSADAGESGGQAFLKWMRDYQEAQAQLSVKDAGGLAQSTPKQEPSAAPQKRAEGFKMLKLHGGEWTEYEFIDGKQIPVIKATSGGGETRVEEPVKAAVERASEYSYLNGSESPFYEPSKTESDTEMESPFDNKPTANPPRGAAPDVGAY
jgi:pilus assembly protein CpaB